MDILGGPPKRIEKIAPIGGAAASGTGVGSVEETGDSEKLRPGIAGCTAATWNAKDGEMERAGKPMQVPSIKGCARRDHDHNGTVRGRCGG